MVSIDSDGFIGGIQMTLSHGDNFSIKMTESALFADYLTTGNETRLIVVSPENSTIFDYSGDFEIVDIIVANSHSEVDVVMPKVFGLSAAYPNPFNPITSINLYVPVESNINVQVYDLSGRSVSTLLSGFQARGNYNLTWDASDHKPEHLYYSLPYLFLHFWVGVIISLFLQNPCLPLDSYHNHKRVVIALNFHKLKQ